MYENNNWTIHQINKVGDIEKGKGYQSVYISRHVH